MCLSDGSYLSRPVSPRSIKNSLEMTATVQTNMFCFTWHKVFSMLNKFEMCWKLKIQKLTMHFLTLWQASPQFLGVRANTVGKVSATTKRRLLSCMIGFFLSFLCFVFGTGTMFTAQLSTLFTRGLEESIWGDGWRARKQDTYCTTSVAAPLGNPNWCTNQPSPTTPAPPAEAMRARLWLWNCLTLVVRHIHCGPDLSHIHDCWYSNSLYIYDFKSSSSQMFDLCGPVPILLATTEMEVATKRSKGNVAFWRLHNSIHILAYNQ